MNKISACLVLRNEEENIRRCLESLLGAVDEIIVVHDGRCFDDTLKICREYTDIIFEMPLAGYMEAHLPFAFDQASGDWILRMDGDEFLSDELKDNLRGIVSSNEAEAYSFIWPIWDGKKVVAFEGSRKLSLFKKDKTSFICIVHFIPMIDGRIKMTDLVIHHQPAYNDFSFKIFIKKWVPRAYLDASTYFKKIEVFNYAGSGLPFRLSARKYFAPILLFLTFPLFLMKGVDRSLRNKNPFYLKVSAQFGLYRTLVEFFVIMVWARTIAGAFKNLKTRGRFKSGL